MDDKELTAKAQALPPVFGNDHWSKARRALRDHMLSNDPGEMLRWSTIIATMQVGDVEYMVVETDYLFDGDANRWGAAVADPGFGGAKEYGYAKKYMGGKPASNLIHQAYYVKKWEERTGKKIGELNFIVEFGGGYGAMAYVCRQLGFEGVYMIYDFPIASLLQEYYLSNVGIHDVWFSNAPFSFDADLFISLWGITEAPLFDRSWVTDRISAKHNMIVYTNQWYSINNDTWIRENFSSETEPLTHISPILHLLIS